MKHLINPIIRNAELEQQVASLKSEIAELQAQAEIQAFLTEDYDELREHVCY